MNSLACLGLVLMMACASATKFNDCGSEQGTVSSVEVSGCPDSVDTCPLIKGQKAEITINFQPKEDSKKVTAVVHGIIKGIPLPFPIQPNACKGGLTCPITSGQSVSYKNSFDVRTEYPSLHVTVRYELKDDSKNDLVCIEIPSVIQ